MELNDLEKLTLSLHLWPIYITTVLCMCKVHPCDCSGHWVHVLSSGHSGHCIQAWVLIFIISL